MVEAARACDETGQPVLIGTPTVADSEHLSELLTGAGLTHQVLNARQDKDEAEIVAAAGQRGRLTVATNMAGRGTDIALGPGVAELGGLHVILTERHEAGRIDRQLAGRCARQGDSRQRSGPAVAGRRDRGFVPAARASVVLPSAGTRRSSPTLLGGKCAYPLDPAQAGALSREGATSTSKARPASRRCPRIRRALGIVGPVKPLRTDVTSGKRKLPH